MDPHPAHDKAALSQAEDAARMLDIERRLIRIETRLTKLLHHFGLRSDGTPRSPRTYPCVNTTHNHTGTQRDEP